LYPIILNLGPLTIHSYGFFISLGFTFGILLAAWRASSYGIEISTVLDMAIYTIVAAIVGSRILYVIVNYRDYTADPIRILYIHKGGLVFFGGLIGVIAVLSYYIHIKKMNFFSVADLVMVCLPLGHFFGRIGCFLNGCCYGGRTECGLGIVFPNLRDHVHRHPTQLYEAFACLAFLAILLLLEKYWTGRREGMLFVLYTYMYSIWRFLIEFVRDDDRGDFWFGLSPSQNISVAGVIFATIMLAVILSRPRIFRETVGDTVPCCTHLPDDQAPDGARDKIPGGEDDGPGDSEGRVS